LLAASRSRGGAAGPRSCRRRVLVPFALSKGTRKRLFLFSYLWLNLKIKAYRKLAKKDSAGYCGDSTRYIFNQAKDS
jgi:hypothetical protein